MYSGIVGVCVGVRICRQRHSLCISGIVGVCVWCANLLTEAQFVYSGIVGVCVLVCEFVDRGTVCVFWYCRCVCWGCECVKKPTKIRLKCMFFFIDYSLTQWNNVNGRCVSMCGVF